MFCGNSIYAYVKDVLYRKNKVLSEFLHVEL